jgi:acyl-coenzyme A thioesterase PaaI-like protein
MPGLRRLITVCPVIDGPRNYTLFGYILIINNIFTDPMHRTPIQDHYTDDVSRCYGCGRLNEHGLQIKTVWDGTQSVTEFRPKEYHTAIPGYVYGGLIASLIDCHGTGTAAAAMAEKRKLDFEKTKAPRFVTASLHVNYRKPTPITETLRLIGTVTELTDRKVVVAVRLFSGESECADGTVVSVELPSGI